jgi:hypothetical protein
MAAMPASGVDAPTGVGQGVRVAQRQVLRDVRLRWFLGGLVVREDSAEDRE